MSALPRNPAPTHTAALAPAPARQAELRLTPANATNPDPAPSPIPTPASSTIDAPAAAPTPALAPSAPDPYNAHAQSPRPTNLAEFDNPADFYNPKPEYVDPPPSGYADFVPCPSNPNFPDVPQLTVPPSDVFPTRSFTPSQAGGREGAGGGFASALSSSSSSPSIPRSPAPSIPSSVLLDDLANPLNSIRSIARKHNISLTQLNQLLADPAFVAERKALANHAAEQTRLVATLALPMATDSLARAIARLEKDIANLRHGDSEAFFNHPYLPLRWEEAVRRCVQLLARLSRPLRAERDPDARTDAQTEPRTESRSDTDSPARDRRCIVPRTEPIRPSSSVPPFQTLGLDAHALDAHSFEDNSSEARPFDPRALHDRERSNRAAETEPVASRSGLHRDTSDYTADSATGFSADSEAGFTTDFSASPRSTQPKLPTTPNDAARLRNQTRSLMRAAGFALPVLTRPAARAASPPAPS